MNLNPCDLIRELNWYALNLNLIGSSDWEVVTDLAQAIACNIYDIPDENNARPLADLVAQAENTLDYIRRAYPQIEWEPI